MSKQEPVDWYVRIRGSRESTPLGTTTFITLRLLDGIVLQRWLQEIKPLAMLAPLLNFEKPSPEYDQFRLPFLDITFQDAVWFMSIGAAVKQATWRAFISGEPMFVDYALFICVLNTIINSINTLSFSLAASNPTWNPTCMYVGTTLYVLGILIEFISEVQRKRFKNRNENQGKLYTDQLFGWTRSVNYSGYLVWRTGFALAAGGLACAAAIGAWLTWVFVSTAIPAMESYLSRKYGKQWEVAKQKVPYALIPYVY